jgi:hypothetical protein
MSRDTASPVLPPAVEVPSVVAMQRQRGAMLLCRDLLPRSYGVCLWYDELRTQCMVTLEQDTYSLSSIQAILLDFLASRLKTLTNASILLNLRRPMAGGGLACVDDGLRSIAHEYEQLAAWRKEITTSSKPGPAVEQSCTAHLVWLLHRHHAWHRMTRSGPPYPRACPCSRPGSVVRLPLLVRMRQSTSRGCKPSKPRNRPTRYDPTRCGPTRCGPTLCGPTL